MYRYQKEYDTYDFGSLIHRLVQITSNQVYFVVIGKPEKPIPFESVKVPERTLSELIKSEETLQKKMKRYNKKSHPIQVA